MPEAPTKGACAEKPPVARLSINKPCVSRTTSFRSSEALDPFVFKCLLVSCMLCLILYVVLLSMIRHEMLNVEKMAKENIKKKIIDVPTQASAYDEYLQFHHKFYDHHQIIVRFKIFKEALKKIELLNKRKDATYGLTYFSDIPNEELFSPQSLSECRDQTVSCPSFKNNNDINNSSLSFEDPPEKFDWRDHSAVGPVREQKQCLGCWAFGIVGVMESMTVIQARRQNEFYELEQLSVQELLDCSRAARYTEGCNLGHVMSGMKWLCDLDRGLVPEDIYPEILVDESCKYPEGSQVPGRRLQTYTQLCDVSTEKLLSLIKNHGPVMAVVNADHWQFYMGGVVQSACVRSHDGASVDHVVQIVGYDLTDDIPYYIVRNSWGPEFGIGGYIYLAIGHKDSDDNVCGIRDEIAHLNVYL